MKISCETFWVFDLDDTLYKEKNFHYSGIMALLEYVESVYDINLNKDTFYTNMERDYFSDICEILRLPQSAKENFLWVYRNHKPNISLTNEVEIFLKFLEKNSKGIAILTDGRCITQRNKIKALKLNRFPSYISQDYESTKPEKKRFEIIMTEHEAAEYVYVGDNPAKDFLAPNLLNWKSVMLKDCNLENVHKQQVEVEEDYLPQITVKNLSELRGFIC